MRGTGGLRSCVTDERESLRNFTRFDISLATSATISRSRAFTGRGCAAALIAGTFGGQSECTRGRNPVLVVDEAHLLDNHQLEAFRLPTNHDMDSGSPFAVVLVGQPTLRHRLRLGALAALDQRNAVGYSLPGTSPADTADYIGHHTRSPAAPTLCSPTTRWH